MLVKGATDVFLSILYYVFINKFVYFGENSLFLGELYSDGCVVMYGYSWKHMLV